MKDKRAESVTIEKATIFNSIQKEIHRYGAHAWHGVKDACAIPPTLIIIYGSNTIQTRALKCFLLNGLIFLGSLTFFEYVVIPMIYFVFGNTLMMNSSGDATPLASTMKFLTKTIYHLFWVYPIYCISFVLNSTWYQEIADRAYRLQVGKPETVEKSYDSVLNGMVEVIYEAFLILNYLIFASLVHAIPIMGPLVSFIYLCWLNAYYSFEYKWINKGWSLDQRLSYFEEHWAYFAGFGFPGTICSFFFPSFINVGVFAMLFPLFIIMANRAIPMPHRPSNTRTRTKPSILERLPIFHLAKKTNLFWIRKLNNTRIAGKMKAKSK